MEAVGKDARAHFAWQSLAEGLRCDVPGGNGKSHTKIEQFRGLSLSRCPNSQLNFQMQSATVQQHQGADAADH
jgi:hypothetical protein